MEEITLTIPVQNMNSLSDTSGQGEAKKGGIKERNLLRVITTREGRLRLLFAYAPKLVELIKTMPYYKWDKDNKWWTLPHSEQIRQQLEEAVKVMGWQIVYEEQGQGEKRSTRSSRREDPRYRSCPVELVEKMVLLRYSPILSKAIVACLRSLSTSFQDMILRN
jgi:hypothetical protein